MTKSSPFRSQTSVPQTSVQTPKRKWVVLPFLWKGFKRVCFALGLMMLISITVTLISISALTNAPMNANIPDKAVLYLEFKDEIKEVRSQQGLDNVLGSHDPTLRDMVAAIDHAATDDRIHGIAARMYDGSFGLAHVQEIRAALKRFKATGKFTKIYSTSFGSAGGGLSRFYLASAFDERWMQPMGAVSIAGVRAEVPFLKSVLDKIGVQPQFIQKKEYKTAYESLTRESISPQNRQMMRDLVGNIETTIIADVPADLNMSEQQFRELVKTGIFTAEEAINAKLITFRDYIDVMAEGITFAITGEKESEQQVFITAGQYLSDINGGKAPKHAEVALVYISGAIMSTNGSDFAKDGVAASEIVAPAIIQAAKDEHIKAIILRVDSPGGSPSASESILRAVQIAQAKGKTVYVSMGSVAASGGYWVSASADRIFALSTTLTGSIGVVGGKFALQDLWGKIGVNWDDRVGWGQNAGIWSPNTPFSPSEYERMDAVLDDIYSSFLGRVAKGRGMEKYEVDRIARGRVWTGDQALEVGLVDQIGDLHDVMSYTAKELGKDSAADLNVVVLPRPKTLQQQITDLLANGGLVMEGLRLQGAIASMIKPAVNKAQVLETMNGYNAYEPLIIR